ncbi:MAG TPA: hypothetical protein PKM65_10845 [Spirochaetota bacterium]|nr:hypothetical protein [Spirochaetota bacterium]HNT09295.1 hypothetical protein [Spirochaetota bacterium]HNV48157.1 hypothetical protein [Spirochaetota bacterium]HOS41017.1 hypothetical protein [Spirochaetota bacterium]HPU87872.1 hypothetical protein [Spirochaetota bacterium]
MANLLSVTVKLYSGIDKDLALTGYDPATGIGLTVARGTRLRRILKSLGMKKMSGNAYFINGARVGLWKSIREECEIACLKPSAGG